MNLQPSSFEAKMTPVQADDEYTISDFSVDKFAIDFDNMQSPAATRMKILFFNTFPATS